MARAGLAFGAGVLAATCAFAQEARVTVSSRAGDRLTHRPSLRFEAAAPGAVRIGVAALPAGAPEGVRCLAFEPPEGGVVAQRLNSGETASKVPLVWGKRAVDVEVPARSIVTVRWP